MYQKLCLNCPIKTKARMKLTACRVAISTNSPYYFPPTCITAPSIAIPCIICASSANTMR